MVAIYAAPPAKAREERTVPTLAHALPELPSLFEPIVALREGGDAMARAVEMAPRHGAGTLAWVRSAARIEAAVVLEPEEPLGHARAALFAAANALADAAAAFGPPEIPITFRWPATVLVNGAAIGRARIAWAEGAPEDAAPDWIVVAVEARLNFPPGWEGGMSPGETALQEEGWEEDLSAPELTAAWARHLMANLAEWGRAPPHAGFRRLAERYLARLEGREEGVRRGIEPATGDLILERDGARERLALLDALR